MVHDGAWAEARLPEEPGARPAAARRDLRGAGWVTGRPTAMAAHRLEVLESDGGPIRQANSAVAAWCPAKGTRRQSMDLQQEEMLMITDDDCVSHTICIYVDRQAPQGVR